MRRNYLILFTFLLSACTIQQENGNDWRLQAPPLLAGNHWQITKQFAAQNGERVCTISAGEMDVTQRGHGKSAIIDQVSVSTPINPGDRYRIIYDDDVHETLNGESTFTAEDSQAIIADLMKGGFVYTEIQERVINWGGGEYQRRSNKIDLSGFGKKFKACKRFVTSGGH